MSGTSRIVAAWDDPIEVADLQKVSDGLTAIYGEGLTIGPGRWTRFEVRTPGPLCGCHACTDRDTHTIDGLTDDTLRTISRFMILCPDCGNKRCPKATHHDQECTGSNEPGQEGSVYGPSLLDRLSSTPASQTGRDQRGLSG